MRPIALKPSDRVAVVAPAGPFDRESFEAGLRVIAQRYQPSFEEGLFSRQRYLAGNDQRRLQELTAALTDPSIKAVFAARGGYGSMRLLSRLPWERLTPKVLVGFSDITALHAGLQRLGWVSIHGPVLTQLGKQPPEVVERLFQLLESNTPPPPLAGGRTLVAGSAEGPLVGGNLSVLTRLLGTPFLPSFREAVLLLEDVTERPYRLDRMWTHLALAGVFQQAKGIVLGEFTQCDEPQGGISAEAVLAELAQETGLPCAAGFPIGHGALNHPVALGARVALDATAGSLAFLEPAVIGGHPA